MDYEMKQNFEAAIPIFGEMHKHFQNRSDMNLRLERAKKEEEMRRGSQKKQAEGIGIAVAMITMIVLATFLSGIYKVISEDAQTTISLFLGVISIVVGFVARGAFLKNLKEHPYSPEFIQQETIINQNMQNELNAVKQIYANNWELIEYFPNDYRYSYAIEQIYKILLNGRADSMKEALNIFEEDCHRRRMEQQLAQILQTQMELCGYLVEISSEVYQLRQQMNQMQNKNGGIW